MKVSTQEVPTIMGKATIGKPHGGIPLIASKEVAGISNTSLTPRSKRLFDTWRGMTPIWLDNKSFISLAVEMIVENSNLYATLYYYQLFQKDRSGIILIETGTYGINPDIYSAQNEIFIVLMAIFALYLIIFLGQFFQAAKKLQRGLKECLSLLKNNWTGYDYLEIILAALTTTIIVIFAIIDLVNANRFRLPIMDSDTFDAIISYALTFKVLSRIASCTCFMSVVRLVALLKIKFPSFGVLFETIKVSKNDIINFGVMGIIIYIGFTLSCMLGMGVHDATFSSFSNTSTRVFGISCRNHWIRQF